MSLVESSNAKHICVFTASKRGSQRLERILKKNNHQVTFTHSNMDEEEHQKRLDGFENGKYRFLLVTDLSGGKLELDGIDQLINYDVPEEPDEYKLRLDLLKEKKGAQMISLVSKQDQDDLKAIAKALDAKLEELPLPKDVEKKVSNRKKHSKSQNNRNRKRGRGRGRGNNRGRGGRNNNRGKSSQKKKRQQRNPNELPKPSYDKLPGGKEGHDEPQSKPQKEEKKGFFGKIKDLFSS